MSRDRSRRQLLVGLASGLGVGVAGCGYQPVSGEREWRSDSVAPRDASYLGAGELVVAWFANSYHRYDFDAERWESGEETVVRAFDTAGNTAFETRFEPPPAAEPAANDTHLFVPTVDGSIVAVRHEDGIDDRIDWRVPVSAEPFTVDATAAAVLSLSGDGLVCQEAATGGRRWDRSVDPGATMVAVSDEAVCLAVDDGTIHAYDLGSGERRWRRDPELDGSPSTIEAGADGTVLVGRGRKIVALDGMDGSERWRDMFDADVASLSPFDGQVVIETGNGFRSHDIDTGEVRWTHLDDYRVSLGPVGTGDGIAFVGEVPNVRTTAIGGIRPNDGLEWAVPLGTDSGEADDLHAVEDTLVVADGRNLYGFRAQPGDRWSVL